jgi:hypothetical protein
MAALIVFSLMAVARPSTALGTTTIKQAVCWASLRTSASTSATTRATIHSGARVTVVARVTGGWWRSTCGTRTVSSNYWYKISAINGKSVMSLYGRSYLYAVTVRFKSVTTSTPTSPSGSYGPGIGADSLANTQVGGPLCRCTNSQTSYRFRATTSSALSSIRIYLIDGSGYSGGTGGTMSISIQSDDGTTSHRPSGKVLASTTIRPGNPISIGHLPLITFGSPASLTSGTLYHVVFRNADPSPTTNYVSVNSLWTTTATTPRQPGLNDLYWAQLMNTGSGWTTRSAFTPILDLGYANGVHGGMGYMEVWIRAARSISGASAVREIFTPTVSRTVSSVSVRVRRASGSSPLTVRLVQTSTGAVLASGTISAGSVGSGQTWVRASLSGAVSLKAGVAYQLRLTAPSDTVYSTFGIERGNHYHFSASTYFHDGYGQYTTGSGWTGFDQPGGSTNNTNADLQFLLR